MAITGKHVPSPTHSPQQLKRKRSKVEDNNTIISMTDNLKTEDNYNYKSEDNYTDTHNSTMEKYTIPNNPSTITVSTNEERPVSRIVLKYPDSITAPIPNGDYSNNILLLQHFTMHARIIISTWSLTRSIKRNGYSTSSKYYTT